MTSRYGHSRTIWKTGVILLLLAGRAAADGVVRDSVGAVSSGRAGTNIAHFDNGAVLLNNPAGMVNIEQPGLFEYGVDTLVTDLDYSDPENNASAAFRPAALPQLSFIRKSGDGDLAMGVGIYAPAGFSAEWDLRSPLFGTQEYKSFGALVKVVPGIAHRLNDRLSVGATIGLGISHAELESPFFLQTGPLAGTPAMFDLQGTGYAPTWSAGLQYQLSDRTNFGLVYTSETRFTLQGDLTADVLGLGPQPVNSNFDADIDIVWPRSAGAGLTHWLTDRQRWSLDVLWFDWSSAFDRIDLKLTDSSNPLFTAMLGPVIKDSIELKWEDSVSVRTGYEFFCTECDVVRAGYTYNSQTIPSSTLTPLIPAILGHSFTIGYGKNCRDWQFNIAYQYAFGPERNVDISKLAGNDFDHSTVRSQAHWLFLSFIHQI